MRSENVAKNRPKCRQIAKKNFVAITSEKYNYGSGKAWKTH